MKTQNLFMAGASVVAALMVRTADAQEQTTVVQNEPSPSPVVYKDTSDYYRDHEFSIDLFGGGSIGEQTIDHLSGDRVQRNGRLAAGAGVNIFFSKYVGIGADAYSENTTGPFVDYAYGNLILRAPISDTGIAPYIFGGGGYQFDPVKQRLADFGGGVEVRFTPGVGIFADARYVVADQTDNFGMGRVGLRFIF